MQILYYLFVCGTKQECNKAPLIALVESIRDLLHASTKDLWMDFFREQSELGTAQKDLSSKIFLCHLALPFPDPLSDLLNYYSISD